MQHSLTAAGLLSSSPSAADVRISDTELLELFDLVDLDHSGEIDIDELCILFGKFGPTPSATEVLDMMNANLEHGQAPQGYGMTISFEQFKAIILGGSKDSSSFTRRELESAFVSLQSHKDPRGKINQPRFKELMRSFGPKSDRETSRKQLQIIKEYSNEGSFDFHKLLQALEDEGVLTKEPKIKRALGKKVKTPASKARTPKTATSAKAQTPLIGMDPNAVLIGTDAVAGNDAPETAARASDLP